jgi:hypothetical protein
MNTNTTPIQTIPADQLCALTGYSDRRHRQLAKAGYFPPPLAGEYHLNATIRGLFKHFREQAAIKKNKREQIDTERHRKLKLENDETEGRLTDTQVLISQVGPMLASFRNEVYTKIETELPRSLAGVDVPTGRIIARRVAADLLLALQACFRNVERPTSTPKI